METTLIFPSPNWFQESILAVSKDGWLVYGGPSKNICVLEPLNSGTVAKQAYKAHVVNKAHTDKIVSVDISQEWPEKKVFLTGSVDGSVKQWRLDHSQDKDRIIPTHCLDIHKSEKEEIAGVGYSTDVFAITVGCFGVINKWDLTSNVAKTYGKFLKNFKPTSMACSHHIPLNVAVGTKQGVVFLLDLKGQGKITYKVRGQDDEIVSMSWCPQYEILVRKSFVESQKLSKAMGRLEKIRSESGDENLNESGKAKNLPDDSFDESVVEEEDMFDMYKDCEADEFGHKKFEPEDIIVRVVEERESDNFLAECLKLKEDIIKKKNEPETSIATLVEALDKTHVDNVVKDKSKTRLEHNKELRSSVNESSAHVHKHLLATIGKQGGVRIWSKSGKLVGSCLVPNAVSKNQRNKGSNSTALLWYKPNVLLIADGKSQLLECNPMKIDCKNKLDWKIVHTLHKRGLYCIVTNAPRVQVPKQTNEARSVDPSRDQWRVWTIAQDRSLICYSMEMHKKIAIYGTCGGFLYTVLPCPYDAKKMAISVGDGAVRVWEADMLDDETQMSIGQVTSYWQNVQGKVLTVAWHPTKENLLAFATGEARVGLIDASGKLERPAKTLIPVLRGGVYSLCWGNGYDLYASGGGELVMYRTNKPDEDPVPIKIQFEGKPWDLCSVAWTSAGLLCGSNSGAVAVLNPSTREPICAGFFFNKMIHSMEWHPHQTSSSSEVSPYKDLIAISSLDRSYHILIAEYADKGDGPKLHRWKTLIGHKFTVLQLTWNPHKDEQLLSTSYDGTVRVWDVVEGVCIAIFGRHCQGALGAAWSPFPQLSSTIISGGTDYCLRMWKIEDYPAVAYTGNENENVSKKEKKMARVKKEDDNTKKEKKDNDLEVHEVAKKRDINIMKEHSPIAVYIDKKIRPPKKFLMPIVNSYTSPCSIETVRRMAQKYIMSQKDETNSELKSRSGAEIINRHIKKGNNVIETNDELRNEPISLNRDDEPEDDEINDINEVREYENVKLDPLKMFGSTNDLNEILDLEMRHHIEYERFEAWIMLAIFRGHIDSMIQFASQRDELCPFLVSLSPCVSFKYWKDVTQLYLAQMDRLLAKREEYKLRESRPYGGCIYRKVALLLSVHDVRGAVNTLIDARLFKEAYVLAKCRHMESIAEETLKVWAENSDMIGCHYLASLCYLALGDPYQASVTLCKSTEQDEQLLSLAAELAKMAGQHTLAMHIEDKKSFIVSEAPDTDTEDLKPLPMKIDLLKDTVELGKEEEDTLTDESTGSSCVDDPETLEAGAL